MKILIIEDELPAQAILEEMLQSLTTDVHIVGKLGSVKESVQWLEQNKAPDLAFVDIQLSDDISFEIFRRHEVSFPVVFTTAYDTYLLESFEFNSIDYLLKPISKEKLKRSLDKVKSLEQHFSKGRLATMVNNLNYSGNKSRLIARKGVEFITMEREEIAYFFTEHKVVFVRDFKGRQFMVDDTLGEWESKMDPRLFFRINRKYLVNVKSIERFKPDNGKIQLFLQPEVKEEVYISKETAPAFRNWIKGEF